MLFWLSCLVLVSAIIFGGATHAGYPGDAGVQLMSAPLLALALWPALSARHPNRQNARLALAVCAVAVLVILIQVMPFPLDIWAGGTQLLSWPAASGFEPERPVWGTVSLDPQASWASAASLIVPLAIFGAAIQLSSRRRTILLWVLLGLGALSLALGFVQVVQGPGSSLRFYDVTNSMDAVGFFANRNHFAAFLYVTLVLAGVRFAVIGESLFERDALNSRSLLWFAAAAALLVAILAGLALARSRAGVLFTMIALAGIVAIILRQRRAKPGSAMPRSLSVRRASFAVIVFGILFAAQFGLGGILLRFEADPTQDLRVRFNRVVWETIPKALPFGTGFGSFVPVYAAAEERQDIFVGYGNRAHNDLAEVLLETGVLGALLLLLFISWFLRRSYKVWMRPQTDRGALQLMLERSATLVILLLLAHSLVDYPLRTAALSAIFAFFCAVLAVPPADAHVESAPPRRRHGQEAHPLAADALGGRWGQEVDWPDSWQKAEAPGHARQPAVTQKFHNPTQS